MQTGLSAVENHFILVDFYYKSISFFVFLQSCTREAFFATTGWVSRTFCSSSLQEAVKRGKKEQNVAEQLAGYMLSRKKNQLIIVSTPQN